LETHDRRVAYARQLLADARKHEPAALLADDLVCEDAELRRCLAWVIDVVDDYADTELDEDLTQVMLGGGLYVAPADVAALCGSCLRGLLDEQPQGPGGPCEPGWVTQAI
jgi:hypothetical protein